MATVTQAVEKQKEEAVVSGTLRQALKDMEGQFAMALPSHLDSGRFLRAALTALGTVKDLQKCTQVSVLAGLMQAAQLGLEVSDVRGQCYLIPRKDNRDGGVHKAVFQLGYRGMIDLAARGGITVDVDEICENDAYDYQRGTQPRLYHKPTLAKRGEVIAYYAVAQFADGRPPTFVIIGKSEAEEHRDKFASQKNAKGEISGPWVEHFDAMARKTTIRMLLNYLPATVELRQAVAIETTAAEEPLNISYLPPVNVQLSAPEGVDAATGEVAGAVETTGGDDAS
jgi:recombination protein RecT